MFTLTHFKSMWTEIKSECFAEWKQLNSSKNS